MCVCVYSFIYPHTLHSLTSLSLTPYLLPSYSLTPSPPVLYSLTPPLFPSHSSLTHSLTLPSLYQTPLTHFFIFPLLTPSLQLPSLTPSLQFPSLTPSLQRILPHSLIPSFFHWLLPYSCFPHSLIPSLNPHYLRIILTTVQTLTQRTGKGQENWTL